MPKISQHSYDIAVVAVRRDHRSGVTLPTIAIPPFLAEGLGWLCPVMSALKRTPGEDFNHFSIMFCYIISTTYQKIGDLFCPVHIS